MIDAHNACTLARTHGFSCARSAPTNAVAWFHSMRRSIANGRTPPALAVRCSVVRTLPLVVLLTSGLARSGQRLAHAAAHSDGSR
eukprot:3364462-Rhodomonas_salina.2